MSGFLYWLPETDRNVSVEALRAAGLAHAFSDMPGERDFTPNGVTGTGGPDGKHGVIIADSSTPKIGYYPDEQTWRQMPATLLPEARSPKPEARLIPWVGFYTADPPGPDDLARHKLLPGHNVRLQDQREWIIPVARGWLDDEKNPGSYTALPQASELDRDGNWSAESVVPEHTELWEIACRFWDSFIGTGDADEDDTDEDKTVFDFAGQNDAALAALSANYRVGKMEVAMLGLFTDQSTSNILEALIDGPTLKTWLKKKAMAEKSAPPTAG